jgi:histone chaperone ASF1
LRREDLGGGGVELFEVCTMSAVNVTNVAVLDNPSMFLNPFQFEISYECLVPLKDGKSRTPALLLIGDFTSWIVLEAHGFI